MRLPSIVGIGFLTLATPSLAAPIDRSLNTRDVCKDPNVSWEAKQDQGCNICGDESLPVGLRIKKCTRFTPAVVHETVEGVWRRSVGSEAPTSNDDDISTQDIVTHEPAPGIYRVPEKTAPISRRDPPKPHDHSHDDDEPWTHEASGYVGRRDSELADLELSSTPRTTHKTSLTSPDPIEHLPSDTIYRRDDDRPGPPGGSGHPGGNNEAWEHEPATKVHTNPGKTEKLRRAGGVLPGRKEDLETEVLVPVRTMA